MSLPTAPARGRRLTALLTTTVVSALALAALGPLPSANAALPAPTLSYVGAASAAGSTTSHVVKVPATVIAGDTMLLFITANTKTGTMTGPTGWTQLQARDGSASRARVWTKKATATDKSTNVTVRTSVKALTSLSVVAYRSSRATSAVTASASATLATAGTSHSAPAVAVSQAGSFLVSYWGGKASVASLWTPPATAVQRTGAGRRRHQPHHGDRGRLQDPGPDRHRRRSRREVRQGPDEQPADVGGHQPRSGTGQPGTGRGVHLVLLRAQLHLRRHRLLRRRRRRPHLRLDVRRQRRRHRRDPDATPTPRPARGTSP